MGTKARAKKTKEPFCGWCGKEGHSFADCPDYKRAHLIEDALIEAGFRPAWVGSGGGHKLEGFVGSCVAIVQTIKTGKHASGVEVYVPLTSSNSMPETLAAIARMKEGMTTSDIAELGSLRMGARTGLLSVMSGGEVGELVDKMKQYLQALMTDENAEIVKKADATLKEFFELARSRTKAKP